MADDKEASEGGISTPIGSLSFKGKKMAEFVAIFCLCVLFLLAYVLYEHKMDAKAGGEDLKAAIKEMTAAQREATQTQRQLNCLISIDQVKREAEYMQPNSFCNRVSR